MARFNNLGRTAILVAFILGSVLSGIPSRAQAGPPTESIVAVGTGANGPAIASLASAPTPSESSEAPLPAAPLPNSSGDDSDWHVDVSPYLWFPGVHGTIGAFGRDVSIHATPGDLLSNFRFGLMGFAEARRKWLILNLDLMWVRLGTSKGLPFPELDEISANVKGGEFLLTPKVGVRVLNRDRIKIDALTGFRYWHFYESVSFVPTAMNLNYSASQDWVDPVVGGKITGILAPKVLLTIFGDAGGWGTGSQLEYQFGGALGYKIKPRWTLQGGYRYLFVNYRSRADVNLVTSGAVLGVTINLK
ncbi:MAG TPA: hypothetical protein VMU43_04065 [Candidatus Acidoferrum sp.]|nr:hypothetical protein [Candidatus Acidoferrum sp.]